MKERCDWLVVGSLMETEVREHRADQSHCALRNKYYTILHNHSRPMRWKGLTHMTTYADMETAGIKTSTTRVNLSVETVSVAM